MRFSHFDIRKKKEHPAFKHDMVYFYPLSLSLGDLQIISSHFCFLENCRRQRDYYFIVFSLHLLCMRHVRLQAQQVSHLN